MINKLLVILLVFCCCGACWNNQQPNAAYVYPYTYQYIQPYYVRPYVEQKVVWVPFVENKVYYAQPVIYVENFQPQQSYGMVYQYNPVVIPPMWVKYHY